MVKHADTPDAKHQSIKKFLYDFIYIRMNGERIIERVRPYGDVIIFFVTLMVANYFWKWFIQGDEENDFLTHHVAVCVYWIIDAIRGTACMPEENMIAFASGVKVTIVGGCSGLKQLFIWTCLMLTVRGGWKQKIWFIPMGWVICHVFNILRIAAIAMLIEFHPERFELYHTYIFKYLFYGMMFLLWVWLVEGIRGDIHSDISASGCDTADAAPIA